jgi:Uma2 family endonuclease
MRSERQLVSVDEYEVLARTGAFQSQRVELIRGRIVPVETPSETVAWTITVLASLLVDRLSQRASVRPLLPLRCGDVSMPSPDFAVVVPSVVPRPHPSEAFLVVEVAKASLHHDRTIKAPLYAEGTTPEYWIVNTAAGQLEVFRKPVNGAWTEHFILGREDVIRPVSFPDIEFPLKAFLLARPH